MLSVFCFVSSSLPHQLFEQSRQDVIQRLVADGCMKLLKGFGCSRSDLLQRVTKRLPHGGDQRLREDEHLQYKHRQVNDAVCRLKFLNSWYV